ncbi:MAG: hypothetical protein K2P81_00455 [Bacteriovoracaceae bacterium]|nr:hypothetical protein [Bacteriovoracaceae bacterium]
MKRYPKFLKVLPEFYGLNFIDIGLVMVGLYGGLILKFPPLVTILFVGVLIGASKTIRKYVDVVGFLSPRKVRVEIKEQG